MNAREGEKPMTAAVFHSAQEYQAAVGHSFGPTAWLVIEQERINLFAEATGDHQWIHVDTERARSGPFGATIAHGFLSLSLVNYFLPELVRAEGLKHGINYGCDRVRFPAAVRVGTRVRGRAEIVSVGDLGGAAVQVKIRVTIEAEGSDKPVCVADTLSRLYF
jgi:acyl dehydratase